MRFPKLAVVLALMPALAGSTLIPASAPRALAAATPSAQGEPPLVALHLAGLQTADGVRYALTFQRPAGVALPGAQARVFLPPDAEIIAALETEGRSRFLGEDSGVLTWQAGDIGADSDTLPFIFTLRETPVGEIIAELTWTGDAPGIATATAQGLIGAAIAIEGALTLGAAGEDAGLLPVGETGVRAGVARGDAGGAIVRVRRPGADENPPEAAGAFWWCAMVEVADLPAGVELSILVPLRQPLAPDTAVVLFAPRDAGWIAVPDRATVTPDGQFLQFFHPGGLLAAGANPINQPTSPTSTPPATPDIAVTNTAVSPATPITSGISVTFTATVANAGTAPIAAGRTVTVTAPQGFSAVTVPAQTGGVTCTAGSGATATCILPALAVAAQTLLAPASQVTLTLRFAARATSPTQGCITAAASPPSGDASAKNDKRSECVTVNPPAPPADRGVSVNRTGTLTPGSTVTYSITVKVEQGTSTGQTVLVGSFDSHLVVMGFSAPGWQCNRTSTTFSCTRSDTLSAPNAFPAVVLTAVIDTCTATMHHTVGTGDNASAANNTVNLSETVACVRFSITLTQQLTEVKLKEQNVYTARLRNVGGTATVGPVTFTIDLTDGIWDEVVVLQQPSESSCMVVEEGGFIAGVTYKAVCTINGAVGPGIERTMKAGATRLPGFGGTVVNCVLSFATPSVATVKAIATGGTAGNAGLTMTVQTSQRNCAAA